MSLIVLTPKRTVLGLNYVIWAINRENRSRGSSWACEGEKKTGQEKSHKSHKYFTYLWRSPHWTDVHENLCNGWCSRRNHVCQVSKWNFQGLQFYRRSNFPFFILILNGPYNSAALLRCLWLHEGSDTEMPGCVELYRIRFYVLCVTWIMFLKLYLYLIWIQKFSTCMEIWIVYCWRQENRLGDRQACRGKLQVWTAGLNKSAGTRAWWQVWHDHSAMNTAQWRLELRNWPGTIAYVTRKISMYKNRVWNSMKHRRLFEIDLC